MISHQNNRKTVKSNDVVTVPKGVFCVFQKGGSPNYDSITQITVVLVDK